MGVGFGHCYMLCHYYTMGITGVFTIGISQFFVCASVHYGLQFRFHYGFHCYVFDFFVLFGLESLAGNRWNFDGLGLGGGRWYKILTVGAVSYSVGRNYLMISRG